MITDVAGRDCTKEFDDVGHSSDAKKLMVKFKIGELVEVYQFCSCFFFSLKINCVQCILFLFFFFCSKINEPIELTIIPKQRN